MRSAANIYDKLYLLFSVRDLAALRPIEKDNYEKNNNKT
jgi:hypothetical protein